MRGWEPGSPGNDMHWRLAHYRFDGHHKTTAASQTGLPLRILSFTSIEHPMATPEAIDFRLQHDARGARPRIPRRSKLPRCVRPGTLLAKDLRS